MGVGERIDKLFYIHATIWNLKWEIQNGMGGKRQLKQLNRSEGVRTLKIKLKCKWKFKFLARLET